MKKNRVNEGMIFCIPLVESKYAIGIVLHVSKLFKRSIIVGFFERIIDELEDAKLLSVDSAFITTPNYTGQQMLRDGDWPIVDMRPDIAVKATIPHLRAGRNIFFKDERVEEDSKDWKLYEPIVSSGMYAVERKLRRHFGLE